MSAKQLFCAFLWGLLTAVLFSACTSLVGEPTPTPEILADCFQSATARAWLDESGDGRWDEGEPPLAGIEFVLEPSAYSRTTSDENGVANIFATTPGGNCSESLQIMAVGYEGYMLTTPGQVDNINPDEVYDFGFRPEAEAGLPANDPSGLAWDHDPETLIIQVFTGSGGSAPNVAHINDLFDAQVWGDGRIVWTTWGKDYQRQVWQGQLSEAGMTALLETFAAKGFFRMKARYAPGENVLDGGATGISVHLLSATTKVSEYVNGAPREFHDLFDLLTSGAGVKGAPYLPQSGHLDAREIEHRDWMDKTEIPIWDVAALGLDLHDAERIWIEGDALMRAWEVVNRNYMDPIVVQGDSYFELRLRLPELSVMEPR